jgi:hypothetical protein
MDPRLSKWLRWLAVIKIEVQELVVAKHTFHEVQKMIEANPKLQTGNSFYHYFTSTYVSHVVIGLRRQLKTDPQSISLALLLKEITETPEVLSRKYYISLYEGSAVEDLADKDFDRVSAPGLPHIDGSKVLADLQRLREATERCEDFADRRVAHWDKRKPKSPPTYNEVDACIDLLDELFVKYQLTFHAQASETLLPTWQYDWKEIFRTPWIEPSS